MASHERREVVTRRVEFVVRAVSGRGAPWAEVVKAAQFALDELSGQRVYDDTLLVRQGDDDEIIVAYEVGRPS